MSDDKTKEKVEVVKPKDAGKDPMLIMRRSAPTDKDKK